MAADHSADHPHAQPFLLSPVRAGNGRQITFREKSQETVVFECSAKVQAYSSILRLLPPAYRHCLMPPTSPRAAPPVPSPSESPAPVCQAGNHTSSTPASPALAASRARSPSSSSRCSRCASPSPPARARWSSACRPQAGVPSGQCTLYDGSGRAAGSVNRTNVFTDDFMASTEEPVAAELTGESRSNVYERGR